VDSDAAAFSTNRLLQTYRRGFKQGEPKQQDTREGKWGIESQNGRSRRTEGFEQERKGLTESTAREGTMCRRIQVGIGRV